MGPSGVGKLLGKLLAPSGQASITASQCQLNLAARDATPSGRFAVVVVIIVVAVVVVHLAPPILLFISITSPFPPALMLPEGGVPAHMILSAWSELFALQPS